jgi:two-component system, OmpR family, sensor kinase
MGPDRAVRNESSGSLSARTMFQIELPLVLTVTFTVLFLVSWPSVLGRVSVEKTYLLLALATAAAAASAAIVAAMITRMLPDGAMPVIAAALAFYGMVVMPLSVGRLASGSVWARAALLGAAFCFLLLMGCALLPKVRARTSVCRGLIGAVVGTALFGVLAQLFSDVAEMLLGSPLPAVLVLFGWCLVAALFSVRGATAGDAVTWRVGLGVGVMAIAHLLRAAGSGQVSSQDIAFYTLRLLGLLLLLGGLSWHARQVAATLRRERAEEYGRLQAAAVAAERAAEVSAERDHEMRNALAGISGAAYVLGSGPARQDDLTVAVRQELARLTALLERPVAATGERSTSVPELLTRLVMLRRANGEDVELQTVRGLRLAMPAAPLAQVVTNLLVNCARHAQGAHVTVRAGGQAGNGWIEVSDTGPGVSAEAPKAGAGSGLGLAVSSRLLAEHGGSLRLLPSTPHRPGCTAVIEIPLAAEPAPVPAQPRRAPLTAGALS